MTPGRHLPGAGQATSRSAAEATAEATAEACADVAAVASLDEPTRRRIYDYVVDHEAAVSREDLAAALGVPLRTAAFHLDRLADLGLLSISFARRTGRSGPGAGRPAKLYQRSAREVSVSLPPRQYDLAGQLLAGAVTQAQQSGEPPREVLDRQARDFGQAMVRDEFGEQHVEQSGQGDTALLISLLEDHGYEPRFAGSDIVMRNCPFHTLAQEHAELVCGMNLHLLEGVLEGLGRTGLRARLDPGPSRCCVRLELIGQQ
jgi:predicted ArsR family transcriptional regulator